MAVTEEQDFVGTAEIEELFEIPRHRVIRFMRRGLWPQPIAPLACGHVFRTRQVKRAVSRLRAAGQLER